MDTRWIGHKAVVAVNSTDWRNPSCCGCHPAPQAYEPDTGEQHRKAGQRCTPEKCAALGRDRLPLVVKGLIRKTFVYHAPDHLSPGARRSQEPELDLALYDLGKSGNEGLDAARASRQR